MRVIFDSLTPGEEEVRVRTIRNCKNTQMKIHSHCKVKRDNRISQQLPGKHSLHTGL